MRIRSIKPEFWRSDDITALDVQDRLLFIGLWSYVDDNGVGRDDLAALLGDLFARDMLASPRETVARVQRGLEQLASSGLVDRYTVNGRPFLYITAWTRHQKIDRPSTPRYPPPDQADSLLSPSPREDASSPRESLAAGTGEQGNRGTGEQSSNDGRKRPPKRQASRIPDDFQVTDAMRDWAAENVPAIDIEAETPNFVDHWHASATATARKLDWVAAWRTWMRNAASRRQSPPPRSLPARPSKDARAIETLRMGAAVQAAREQRGDHTALDGLFTPKALPA